VGQGCDGRTLLRSPPSLPVLVAAGWARSVMGIYYYVLHSASLFSCPIGGDDVGGGGDGFILCKLSFFSVS